MSETQAKEAVLPAVLSGLKGAIIRRSWIIGAGAILLITCVVLVVFYRDKMGEGAIAGALGLLVKVLYLNKEDKKTGLPFMEACKNWIAASKVLEGAQSPQEIAKLAVTLLPKPTDRLKEALKSISTSPPPQSSLMKILERPPVAPVTLLAPPPDYAPRRTPPPPPPLTLMATENPPAPLPVTSLARYVAGDRVIVTPNEDYPASPSVRFGEVISVTAHFLIVRSQDGSEFPVKHTGKENRIWRNL